MHAADEELEADDGVDDDDEEHEQRDVQQRHHRLHDGVEHDVKTWGKHRGGGRRCRGVTPKPPKSPSRGGGVSLTGHAGDEAQRAQHAESAQGFDVEAARFAAHVVSVARFVRHLLQDDAEQPGEVTERGQRHTGPGPCGVPEMCGGVFEFFCVCGYRHTHTPPMENTDLEMGPWKRLGNRNSELLNMK